MHTPLRRLPLLLFLAILIAWPQLAAAQQAGGPSTREVLELRAELANVRAELEALKRLVAERTGPIAAAMPVAGAQLPASQPDPQIAVLQQQIAELAQSKVESTTKFPVKVFGTILAHAFANTGEPNWMDLPNIVQPTPADGHDGTFSAGMRQTRIGFTADGPRIGNARTSGVVAIDFFGGIPGFQTGQVMPLPRLLVGFGRIESDRFAFQAGQDHVILSPREPSSLAAFSFPLLFRSGNLYLRAPQARIEAAIVSRLRLTAGLVAPIGGDVPGEDYRFVPPALGGERSAHPAFQAHLGFTSDTAIDARRRIALGLSGHFGRERRAGTIDESWAGALDFALRHDWIGVAGEAFTGRNIDAFGGATGLNARAAGGWAELQLFPTDRLSMHAGGGTDRLRGNLGTLPRRRNRSAYANIRFALTPEVDAGFEYNWLGTLPGSGAERRNHHFDWVLIFRF